MLTAMTAGSSESWSGGVSLKPAKSENAMKKGFFGIVPALASTLLFSWQRDKKYPACASRSQTIGCGPCMLRCEFLIGNPVFTLTEEEMPCLP